MADANATQTLPTPERAELYKRLVREHHDGTRKFRSVAAFHEEYLEQGGTPRKKSVGKDRLMSGVPIGRKLNRLSKKQLASKAAAAKAGKAAIQRPGYCGLGRFTLVPSESKNNRHGMGGQASVAAAQLMLNRSYTATDALTLRTGPGCSKGGRNYVKVENPYPNGRGRAGPRESD